MTDQDREQSESGDALERVLQILKEIVEKSADGDYIYRGEPKHYCRVSSSLYRKREKIKVEGLDIKVAEVEILKAAREFAGQVDENDLLTQLQHFGSVTNLIDFTTDYLVALFFACDRKPKKDGRVILLEKSGHKLLEPRSPANRVIAQKSVFVRSPQGFVEPSKTVLIPQELKEPILDYLSKCHGVSVATIYNDLHGFIRYHQGHESAYLEFYAGVSLQEEWKYQEAIERYSKAIKLNPQLHSAYNMRGNAYFKNGEFELAIQDYGKAIALDPNFAEAYSNRSNAHIERGNYERAIQDCDKAIELNSRFTEAYCNRSIAYNSIGEYDRAIQDCDHALELNSLYAQAYSIRGSANWGKGEYDRAVKDYDRAIELDPGSADFYSNRGIAYMKKAEYIRAIQDFSKAIELKCENADAYFGRGSCWLVLSESVKAEADLSTAKNLGVDVVSAFRDEFESVAAIEERYKVKLPPDIAALLTPNGKE